MINAFLDEAGTQFGLSQEEKWHVRDLITEQGGKTSVYGQLCIALGVSMGMDVLTAMNDGETLAEAEEPVKVDCENMVKAAFLVRNNFLVKFKRTVEVKP